MSYVIVLEDMYMMMSTLHVGGTMYFVKWDPTPTSSWAALLHPSGCFFWKGKEGVIVSVIRE